MIPIDARSAVVVVMETVDHVFLLVAVFQQSGGGGVEGGAWRIDQRVEEAPVCLGGDLEDGERKRRAETLPTGQSNESG